MKLSVVIIALNDEAVIEGAVASGFFADEVLVVDGGSTDGTVQRAKLAGARIVERPFDDFARQRTFALSQAAGEWVLFVDSDERATPALRDEVRALLAGTPQADCYTVPRKNMALGQWLDWHFGGTDAPRRLVRRAVARFGEPRVHEVLEVTSGRYDALSGELVHLTHRSVSDLVDKINRYAELEAGDAVARGARPPSRRAILASFPKAFWRLWRSGLRAEGDVGAIEAFLLAFNRTLVEIKIWERHHNLAARYAEAEASLTGGEDVAP